ncbi:unnamed protein product [Danaus chrysippus]|uniref:(African queen) hypothetical protein n=1 Tax=Danaus chrysippus TaxID=151541 RepID=A0A8J2QUW7_9NEOP|nr:unnamed protein product [Danaus chrysippus]
MKEVRGRSLSFLACAANGDPHCLRDMMNLWMEDWYQLRYIRSKQRFNKSVHLNGIDTVYNASDGRAFKRQADSSSVKDNADKINRREVWEVRRKYWSSASTVFEVQLYQREERVSILPQLSHIKWKIWSAVVGGYRESSKGCGVQGAGLLASRRAYATLRRAGRNASNRFIAFLSAPLRWREVKKPEGVSDLSSQAEEQRPRTPRAPHPAPNTPLPSTDLYRAISQNLLHI